MAAKKPNEGAPQDIELWELKAIDDFAALAEHREPQELAAELSRQWLAFKRRHPQAQVSRPYLASFLRNKLSNWRRNSRRRQAHQVTLDPWDEEERTFREPTLPEPLPVAEPEEGRLAFEEFRESLPPKLRRLLDIRLKRKMTQLAEARWLRKHRNTIRTWGIKLHEALIAFAQSWPKQAPQAAIQVRHSLRRRNHAPYSPDTFLPVSLRFLDALVRFRLSGIQCRILLKVLLDTYRCKRRAVPFSWYAMARDLAVDRANLYRAGRLLLRRGLIFVDGAKIGLERHWVLPPPEPE